MSALRILNEIDTTPERLWQLLTNLADYPRWNPLLRSIQGELVPGAPLAVHLALPANRVWAFSAQVTTLEPGRILAWRGFRGKPFLLTVSHTLEITPLEPDRVRVILRLSFGGLQAPFLLGGIAKAARPGLLELSQALKEEAEGIQSSLTWPV